MVDPKSTERNDSSTEPKKGVVSSVPAEVEKNKSTTSMVAESNPKPPASSSGSVQSVSAPQPPKPSPASILAAAAAMASNEEKAAAAAAAKSRSGTTTTKSTAPVRAASSSSSKPQPKTTSVPLSGVAATLSAMKNSNPKPPFTTSNSKVAAGGGFSIKSSITSSGAAEASGSGMANNKRPPSALKKRPYRRTKRPKNYCDKSTVTTTTDAVNTPINVYDAVLGEADDLLKAAMEAQSLGRLKMASAYQLLLHCRLVGLGKRFDRAVLTHGPSPGRRRRRDEEDDDDEEYSEEEYDEEEYDDESGEEDETDNAVHDATNAPPSAMAVVTASAPPSALAAPATATATPSTAKSGATAAASGIEASTSATASAPTGETVPAGLPPVLQQLTSILPSNLEMDVTMMEHLARAAVELHHQRTGRKKSSDGLLASPMTGMIGTPEQGATTKKDPASSDSATSASNNINNKIAWTQDEQDVVSKAQSSNPKITPSALSKLLKNKTEAQVKAYLKNVTNRAKNHLEVEEEMTPRKRGGRGRKPPTTAMNTVPNANLDARALLQGKILKISKTPLRTTSTPAK